MQREATLPFLPPVIFLPENAGYSARYAYLIGHISLWRSKTGFQHCSQSCSRIL